MVPPEISAQTRYLHERLRENPPSSNARAEASPNQAASNSLEAGPVAPKSRDRGTKADLSHRSDAKADFLFWKQQFSTGGYDRFPERLRSLEITEPQAAWLTQPCPLPGEETGGWEHVFEQAIRQPPLLLQSADALPFAELWSPLISFAKQSVDPIAANTGRIAASGLDGLVSNLLHYLCDFAAFPTFAVFAESQVAGEQPEAFIRRVRQSDYLILFERFPMLARQLTRLVTSWIDATHLFLDRFQRDGSDVLALARSSKGLLTETKTGISDRHDNGRQVILMTFADGAKALYKPKSVSISEALSVISRWLTERGFNPGWRFARVIARERYGWEEYIEQSPCSSNEEVRSYYRSGGELLCLSYLLNAYDLFRDNLVAAGSQPVPIDTECFFHPGRSEPSSPDRHVTAGGKASVIETGLLPFWQLSASHLPADHSGLGTGVVELPELKVTEWENLNSSDIRPITKPAPAKPSGNTVRWNGEVQDVRAYRSEIIDGFSSLYRKILVHKNDFIGLLEQFGGVEARFLYRPTQVYALLQKGARSPRNLTSGIRQSAIFEQLYRVPLRENGLTAQTKQLIDFEVESLLGLDIPRFNVRLDSRDLRSMDFCAPELLRHKPLDTVTERVAAMGPEDLEFQVEVIQESLSRFPVNLERPLKQPQALSIAGRLADEIRQKVSPGSVSYLWEIPRYLPRSIGTAEHQGVYLGDLGTLIFLAAADKLLEIRCFPEIAHLRDQLDKFSPSASYPLGICHGVGALIYGSLLLGSFTKEEAWTELAVSLNAKRDLFSNIDSLDLTSGVAGFLLATTRLFQATQDPGARSNAEAASRILAERFDPSSGWRQPDGNLYLGFAHGLAGIAFALDQYARATADHQFQPVIKGALALASQQFADHSWPVAMQGPRRTFKNWCNGAAGILMTLASTGALEPERFPSQELTQLLERVSQRGQSDHWCCGNFGIAEALNYVGQEADLPEAKNKSGILLEESLDRGLKGGFFRLQSSLGENFCFSPSLFRGTAGIGYSLLRFAYPGELPCILAFEV